jgi:DNA (cytosine-5)-methyltransferase 1
MLRVIAESRPRWVVAENVSGLIRMELDQVLSDLEVEGYTARTFHIGAVGVNAPHRRMRVWIVANRTDGGRETEASADAPQGRQADEECRLSGELAGRPCGPDSDAPDAHRNGLQEQGAEQQAGGDRQLYEAAPDADQSGLTHRAREHRWASAPGGAWERGDGRRGAIQTGWDIPWIEVASRLCGLDDELSAGLVGYLGITEEHLKVRNKNRVQKLKALGNAIVPAVAFEIIRCIAEIENGNKT